VLIQILCDKNYNCQKDLDTSDTLQNPNQKKNDNVESKKKSNLSFESIVCQPNHSTYGKKKCYNETHSCHPDYPPCPETRNCVTPSFTSPTCCPDHQKKFNDQTSLRFSPSFNLKTNKKSTPRSSCQKQKLQNTHMMTSLPKNCSQTAQPQTQTQSTTVVTIEPPSNFESISNASFYSA